MQSTAHSQHAYHARKIAEKSPYGLYSGRVIDIHPKSTTVDVALYSGDVLRNVRVLFNSANTKAGYHYLASIFNQNTKDTVRGNDSSPSMTHVADTIAVVSFLDGNFQTPRVIGFDFPVDSQLHLDEDGLSVNVHESGVYTLITKEGHHETHYPDGSYVVYGPDTTSKDMSSIQGNGQAWNPATSTINTNMTIHLVQGVTIQAQNGTLTINGGTLNVARETDTVNVPINYSGKTSDGASFTINTTVTGTINSGASNFKA